MFKGLGVQIYSGSIMGTYFFTTINKLYTHIIKSYDDSQLKVWNINII